MTELQFKEIKSWLMVIHYTNLVASLTILYLIGCLPK